MNREVVKFLSEVASDESLQEEASKVERLTDVVLLAGKVGCKFSFDDWRATIPEIKRKREQDREFIRSTPGAMLSIPNEALGLEHFPESVKV